MPALALLPSADSKSAAHIALRLEAVRQSLAGLESSVDLTGFGPQRESARNLLHYLAIRQFDLRDEQAQLARWGLSSLGRSEGHVQHNLDWVLFWLGHLASRRAGLAPAGPALAPTEAREILEHNADVTLGPSPPGRQVRIMVTLPTEAGSDYALVRDLVKAGMDCARVNCAHDGPAIWSAMVAHVRRAEIEQHARCAVEMDLAGPKIRTGEMRPGPRVLKVRPNRDATGRVVTAGSIWIVAPGRVARGSLPGTPLTAPSAWIARRRMGSTIDLRDSRGAKRRLKVVATSPGRIRVEFEKTIYFAPGLRLVARAANGRPDRASVGSLPALEGRMRLSPGDLLVLTESPVPGEDARRGAEGKVLRAAHVACTLPEGLHRVRVGQPVWLDDGKIGGVAVARGRGRVSVKITHAPAEGAWLGADKGINLPETDLGLPPLSPKDLEDLRFASRHADLVGFSFVHRDSDVRAVRQELRALGRPYLPLVLKMETREGFAELPGILLEALREPPAVVMIARGDLAVEVGFERLAEVQEEILWLCEAAHLPVIWATQVLEGLTKNGIPSRAEVSDAAMGQRAECVMLNKGPHVVDAVRALDSILRRMEAHQSKKTAMLRHLTVVDRFISNHRTGPVPRPPGPAPSRAPARPTHAPLSSTYA
jgi:pyruvate kinase